MELIEAFKAIGFTKQEAELYLTLCEHGELTGYEASKHSGISRSNAYASLSNLVEKGGAYLIDGQPTKYIATPKKELLLNARKWLDKMLHYIDETVIFNPPRQQAYITISGQEHIVNKIQNMLLFTQTHLYFSADYEVIKLFLEPLASVAKTKKVVLLCNQPLLNPEFICYQTQSRASLKLIIDTNTVITGSLEQCLYSQNLTLVQLMREAMINEIKLIQYER